MYNREYFEQDSINIDKLFFIMLHINITIMNIIVILSLYINLFNTRLFYFNFKKNYSQQCLIIFKN